MKIPDRSNRAINTSDEVVHSFTISNPLNVGTGSVTG
jgi:hypothetical protein